MPKISGLELTARVKELYSDIRFLILTTSLDAGASGYLLKDRPSEELADAVLGVSRGERIVDPPACFADMEHRKDPLTDRERLILRRAGDGENTADLARSLRLTEGTVRNYLSGAISKLNSSNRIEAARIARNKDESNVPPRNEVAVLNEV
jgi:two-component system response regulator DesR